MRNESLVKTVKFSKMRYVGDPANTVRIFNELEVDELLFLDISASKEERGPNFKILRDIADECFMPLGYGGGIKTFADAKVIFDIGFEKVAVNFSSFVNSQLISELSKHFGRQAVIASIDVKTRIFGRKKVYTLSGKKNTLKDPIDWAKEVEDMGAGEILLTSIDHEGTWKGFDYDLVRCVTDAVSIPVVAHGGAGSVQHIQKVVTESNASAVALGSMIVFQKKGMGVLVNFPEKLKNFNSSLINYS